MIATTETKRTDATYVLGYSDTERQRLIEQARLLEPYTRALLVEAGIGPGMRVLDVGCGVGDVSLLAAELVGPTGRVVGVDTNSRQLEFAKLRAAESGSTHVRFVPTDIREFVADEPFDAAIGRFILMYVGDPVAVVRQVAKQVRPGGVVAFQEYHMEHVALATGANPAWDQARQWIRTAARRSGVNMDMGLRLHHAFVSAGLDAPRMHMDVRVLPPDSEKDARVIAGTLTSILPFLEQSSIATAEEVQAETFVERYLVDAAHSGVVHTGTPLVRAWSRTSAH